VASAAIQEIYEESFIFGIDVAQVSMNHIVAKTFIPLPDSEDCPEEEDQEPPRVPLDSHVSHSLHVKKQTILTSNSLSSNI